jgi:NAD-dependent SIR2 family protein deacetylase
VDTSLDGNAAAGTLGDLFAFDVTMAVSTCAACGDSRPVAELRAYLDPGVVLRCASCGAPQLRLVRSGDRAWLDLRGIQVLEVHGTALGRGR